MEGKHESEREGGEERGETEETEKDGMEEKMNIRGSSCEKWKYGKAVEIKRKET